MAPRARKPVQTQAPSSVGVESQIVEFNSQMVWQLNLVVDLDEGGKRVRHEWRMFVGTPAEGLPDVLHAQQRR